MKTHKYHSKFYIPFALLGALVFFGTACDSGVDGMNDNERTTVTGQVTDEHFTSRTSPGDNLDGSSERNTTGSEDLNSTSGSTVEGAVVTAVAIHANGSVTPLEGEATTNANGEYTIQVEGNGASDHIRLIAKSDNGFESSVIVHVNGRSSVMARPMTFETHAKSRVYIEAKSRDGSDSHTEGTTTADVEFFVGTGVASEINAGAQSASETGLAIANAIKAQAAYNSKKSAGVNMNAIAMAKSQAYAQLQSDIAAAANAQARATAIAKFEEAYLEIYTENGVDAQTQTEMLQTSAEILVKASNRAKGQARLELRKKAEMIRAKATSLALEARFKAESASQATIEALAEARVKLIAEIRAATSTEAILEAKAEFKAAVDAHIEAVFGISSELRAEAEARAEAARKILLEKIANLSVLIGGVADAAAEAFVEFYASARAEASASLQSTGLVNADAAAEVIVLMSLMK